MRTVWSGRRVGVTATVTALTPNVTVLSATQSYPDIAVGGTQSPTAAFQFQTEPGFLCGEDIDFEVDISWAGTPVSRHELAKGSDSGGERAVDVQINRLRRKIENDPTNPVYLQTVRGKGYILYSE